MAILKMQHVHLLCTFLTQALQVAQSQQEPHFSSPAVGGQQVFSPPPDESSEVSLPTRHRATLYLTIPLPCYQGLIFFLFSKHRSITVCMTNKTNSFTNEVA